MDQAIALGFQNTVDFELEWDPHIIESMICAYDIHASEIGPVQQVNTERDILLALLYHMKEGTGTEHITDSSQIVRAFANRFAYSVTLGGTAVRAAIALSMIGRSSVIHACSNNHFFRDLLPKDVQYRCSVPDEGENYCPHVIVQFPANAAICANDISLITPRPNRVIFAYDPPSVALVIDPDFAQETGRAGVFVAASFNAIKEEDIARARLAAAIGIIRRLPGDCTVIMEDGCFESRRIRDVVTETLSPHLQIFSMNEDELQDRYGRKIDILDPVAVSDALSAVSAQVRTPILICHSAHWALAYGAAPQSCANALQGGIDMASTRFRCGDRFSIAEYEETRRLPKSDAGDRFAGQIVSLLGPDRVCCLASRDLCSVVTPTTIGLGDAFIGGMLPSLLPARCR